MSLEANYQVEIVTPVIRASDIEAVKRAMKQSFSDTVAASANMPFEATGVSMPADHVWERYAYAAVLAIADERSK
jgi:hypothetical protein